MARWRGVRDLVFDGVEVITALVERHHRASTLRAARLVPIAGVQGLARAVHAASATPVYRIIQGVNGGARLLTALATDARLDASRTNAEGAVTPLRSDATGLRSWWADQVEGVLNGLLGDHLSARANALAIEMSLRHDGRRVPLDPASLAALIPEAPGCVCVMVHGLSATEWSWCVGAERFHGDPAMTLGLRLQRELGFTPLYVRYNSGQRVADSGAQLSALLDALCARAPWPIERLVLIGHSMGGLVARRAARVAQASGAPWLDRLRHVVCIGSPHHGAPLEQVVAQLERALRAINATGAQVPGEVLAARSAGIRDLRAAPAAAHRGDLAADDPLGLVDGVAYTALSATITRDPDHPLGRLVGDWMVRSDSGVGDHPDPTRRVPFHSSRVLSGIGHVQLANHPAVHAVVVDRLRPRRQTGSHEL